MLDGLERAYIAEGAGHAGMPSLDEWANLLRVIEERGVERRDLPRLLRLSKRAVRTRLATALRRGWITGDRRVSLTKSGAEIARCWRRLEAQAEAHWCERTGAENARQLRTALEVFVSQLPLEHPHYPANYGLVDASITGGSGMDWRAVPRAAGDTLCELSMTALLAQTAVAFAMEYEQRSPVALAWNGSMLQRIPPEGRAAREVGANVAVAALRRHGFLTGEDVLRLTARGRAASEGHAAWIREVEAEWRERFGAERMAALQQALERAAAAARKRAEAVLCRMDRIRSCETLPHRVTLGEL
ncbi:MAG TPA: hypothetical protein VKX25_13830 [Bryobacteraceae bacterium]|nr:hypothetical protein [Bryobacteraceae bacterium]